MGRALVRRGLVSTLGCGLVLGALFIGGCDSVGETTALGISAGEPSFAMTMVEVCHRNRDGSYVRISIADAAYAHGTTPFIGFAALTAFF